MDALNKLIKKVNIPKKIDVIVVRVTSKGLAYSRPCFHCLEGFEKSGLNIKNIYYSTKDGGITKEKFFGMKDKSITRVSSGVRSRERKLKNKIN